MKALLLAAGQGQRMRPDSLHCPKPLLQCGPHRLIEYHLYRLAQAGFQDILINISYRSQDFAQILGDGTRYGVHITYLYEPPPCYETGGAVIRALSQLGTAPFLLMSSDIYTTFPLHEIKHKNPEVGHLMLIQPTEAHTQGDFHLESGEITTPGGFTYGNIGVFNPAIFTAWPACRIPLRRILNHHLNTAPHFTGDYLKHTWHNVSTPQERQQLHQQLLENPPLDL